MVIVDRGTGAPIVLIPGIQGRWEYMAPAVEALARSFRVLTFPLAGERGTDAPLDPARGVDPIVDQVGAVLAEKGLQRAVICGISFGGLAAIRFAALHPDRTEALVLASTPGPGWHLKRRHALYLRAPWLFGMLFLAEVPWRLNAELVAAMPDRTMRKRFMRAQSRTLVTARPSFARMAARARIIQTLDLTGDCARITAPTLVVTGERRLDHVVDADGARSTRASSPARGPPSIEQTGHLGSITRPDAFAALVRDFIESVQRSPAGQRTSRDTSPRDPRSGRTTGCAS